MLADSDTRVLIYRSNKGGQNDNESIMSIFRIIQLQTKTAYMCKRKSF